MSRPARTTQRGACRLKGPGDLSHNRKEIQPHCPESGGNYFFHVHSFSLQKKGELRCPRKPRRKSPPLKKHNASLFPLAAVTSEVLFIPRERQGRDVPAPPHRQRDLSLVPGAVPG